MKNVEKRILVVDDDEFIRDVLQQALTESGYSVAVAADGAAARAAVSESAFDLVITDVLMPGEDGIETIRWLRKLPEPPMIIAMSGGGSLGATRYLDLARKFGAVASIGKPFSPFEVVLLVEQVLAAD